MITQEINKEISISNFNDLTIENGDLITTLLIQNQQLSLENQQLNQSKNENIEFQNQNTKLKSQIDSLQKQLKLQQQKIDYLLRQRFSPKSEQLSSNQLSLFADLEQKEIETPKEEEKIEVTYTRAKGGKKRPPKD